jgi:hypothetical protein
VLILRPTDVGVDPSVKLDGVKLHAAYAGRLEQLIAMVPLNVPDSLTLRLKLAGWPAGTVAVDEPVGVGNTKSDAVPLPDNATICKLAPEALTVRVALSLLAVEGLKVIVIVQVAAEAMLPPQPEVTTKSAALVPLTPVVTPVSATVPEFVTVTVCCALEPSGSELKLSD